MKKYIIFISCFLISICLFGCFKTTDLEKIAKNKTSYNMNLTFDEKEHTLTGEQTVSFVNNTNQVLKNVCFHLYPNSFSSGAVNKPVSELNTLKAYPNGFSEGYIEIKKVLVNNKETTYEIIGEDEDILDVNFKIPLQPTALHEIYIKYVVEIPNVLHRFGYTDNSVNLANFYPIVCVYENNGYVTSPYNFNGDPFYSEIASYDVSISYPKNYTIASTGTKNISTSGISNKCKMQANAVRDFAIVLSKKFNVISQMVNNTQVSYYYYGDENAQQSLDTCVKSFKTFNNLFGKYPYSTLDIVETGFVYGGMEYPNIVFISDNLSSYEDYTYVIVHEIAHQWWYGLVGNNEYNYGWLDEGLAEYSCLLFYENNEDYNIDYNVLVSNALANYELFLDVYNQVFSKVDTSMNRSLDMFATEPEYTYTAYTKAMLMHDALRNILSTTTYLNCLKNYFNEFKFKNVTPLDMINSFSKTSNRDLTNFFNSWINGDVVFSTN